MNKEVHLHERKFKESIFIYINRAVHILHDRLRKVQYRRKLRCFGPAIYRTERSDLEKAAQPEQLKAGKDVYLSVYFIESVKGMEYTVKWYMNEKEIKTDTQKFPVEKKVFSFLLWMGIRFRPAL